MSMYCAPSVTPNNLLEVTENSPVAWFVYYAAGPELTLRDPLTMSFLMANAVQ